MSLKIAEGQQAPDTSVQPAEDGAVATLNTPAEGQQAPAAGTTPSAPATPPATTPEAPAPATPAPATPAKIGEPAPVTLKSAAAELARDGTLSDATTQALQARGLDAADVQTFAAGLAASTATAATSLYEAAGGEARYNEVIAWASTGADAETRAAYNAAIDRNDFVTARYVLQGMQAQFAAAEGLPPAHRVTGQPATGGLTPYATREQVAADMRDPRYQRDAAFRDTVAARLARSQF